MNRKFLIVLGTTALILSPGMALAQGATGGTNGAAAGSGTNAPRPGQPLTHERGIDSMQAKKDYPEVLKGEQRTGTTDRSRSGADSGGVADKATGARDTSRAGIAAGEGVEIVNAKGETIGEIVAVQNNYLIASVGSYLGMGEHLVAIPADRVMIRTAMTKDELAQMTQVRYRGPDARFPDRGTGSVEQPGKFSTDR